MKNPQPARLIKGDKTLATLLGPDLTDRRLAHLEVANPHEALFAISVTGHEPLRHAAFGVADDQRNTADQLSAGSDFGVAVFQQLVTPIEAAITQAEHIRLRPAIDDIHPLLAWVDIDGFDLGRHLRQFDARLLTRHLAGHHVFFLFERHDVQLGAGRTRHFQAVAVRADRHVFDRRPASSSTSGVSP